MSKFSVRVRRQLAAATMDATIIRRHYPGSPKNIQEPVDDTFTTRGRIFFGGILQILLE